MSVKTIDLGVGRNMELVSVKTIDLGSGRTVGSVSVKTRLGRRSEYGICLSQDYT